MIDQGVTWILAADGGQARVFQESLRGGPVHELPERAMRQGEHDRPEATPHAATSHQRSSPGRHAGKDANPAQEAEDRFLGRVVEMLHAAARQKAFDRLVIMAPPTALGQLRGRLTAALAAQLDASDAHDRVRDDAEAMRAHLRQLRAKA